MVLRWLNHLVAAVAFYTCLPVPRQWQLDFQGIARYAPLIGLGLGGLLSAGFWGLQALGMPLLTRSALIVGAWVALTGGLHLDGAMDTADGLAVLDPHRRLAVMADSRSGAFGVMAAIAILGIKTVSLSELGTGSTFALLAVAGWGRWGQVVAIACYPYLKPTGKGAFHKTSIRPIQDMALGLGVLLGLSGGYGWLYPERWLVAVGIALGGFAIAVLTAAWFNAHLGGHTGDTYGAVVEWTETLLLCLITLL